MFGLHVILTKDNTYLCVKATTIVFTNGSTSLLTALQLAVGVGLSSPGRSILILPGHDVLTNNCFHKPKLLAHAHNQAECQPTKL
jgi:hypothetical protein